MARGREGSSSISKRPLPQNLPMDTPPAKLLCVDSINEPVLVEEYEELPVPKILFKEDENDLDTLFEWGNNSCAYDTLLSPLYYVYKRKLNESERASFPQAIKSLFDMAMAETTMADIKVQLMSVFFTRAQYSLLVHLRLSKMSSITGCNVHMSTCRTELQICVTCIMN